MVAKDLESKNVATRLPFTCLKRLTDIFYRDQTNPSICLIYLFIILINIFYFIILYIVKSLTIEIECVVEICIKRYFTLGRYIISMAYTCTVLKCHTGSIYVKFVRALLFLSKGYLHRNLISIIIDKYNLIFVHYYYHF